MATSTRTAVRSALKTQLDARGGLSGVKVYEFPPLADGVRNEMIYFVDIDSDQERLTLDQVEEQLIVEGIVWVHRSGKGDATAAEAEDRAAALFAEVETEIRDTPTIGSSAWDAEISTSKSRPGVDDQGRWNTIEFKIRVTSILA